MINEHMNGFYGNDIEDYYVSTSGNVFVINSPDITGDHVVRINKIPSNATRLSAAILDPEYFELAQKIEKGNIKVL